MERKQFDIWMPVEVRWADMDAMGHVNNAAYFLYFESARVRFYDSLEVGAWYERDRQGFALVTTTCNFRHEVRYPATLDVGTRVTKLSRRSLHFEQAMFFHDTDSLVADGTSVLVWLDYEQHKAVEFPPPLRARLEEHAATKPLT